MASTKITVKAFLQRQNSVEPEIRRFPLVMERGHDLYNSLLEKVIAVFSGLTPKNFTLYWKGNIHCI